MPQSYIYYFLHTQLLSALFVQHLLLESILVIYFSVRMCEYVCKRVHAPSTLRKQKERGKRATGVLKC